MKTHKDEFNKNEIKNSANYTYYYDEENQSLHKKNNFDDKTYEFVINQKKGKVTKGWLEINNFEFRKMKQLDNMEEVIKQIDDFYDYVVDYNKRKNIRIAEDAFDETNDEVEPQIKEAESNERTNTVKCKAFKMEDPEKALKHIRDNWEKIENYGDWLYDHPLYLWDDGKRILGKCEECDQLFLLQCSEFHDFYDGDDSRYDDYFPVSSSKEADELNKNYSGEQIEFNYKNKWLCVTNGNAVWKNAEEESEDNDIMDDEEYENRHNRAGYLYDKSGKRHEYSIIGDLMYIDGELTNED